ncbi:hypothetical protein GUJ93_ZPchr0006g42346 [Zizania palustris]|uniref:Lipoyl-binding domain-containing protein n=1 Tax=Zizania palustris TaxID=103762 RepID=A0A8J5SFD8_ZIZPA|nr:hypothetical protein GUJ93_ZPchr0006g42346 [Zizania palustris]
MDSCQGRPCKQGDVVVVVEFDKEDMDVETFHDGIVAAVLVAARESTPVGARIVLLTEFEEDVQAALSKAQELSKGQPQ